MIAESLSPRNGGNVGLLLGAGVAMECSIGFHFLSIYVLWHSLQEISTAKEKEKAEEF